MSSKQFVLLQATRDLENYVSRERYNLSKMRDNPNVPFSLLHTKVEHFNQLLLTLNNLFSALTYVEEDLFTYFTIGEDEYAPIDVSDSTLEDTADIRDDVDMGTGEIYSDMGMDESDRDTTPMYDDVKPTKLTELIDSDEEHEVVQADSEMIDDGVDDEVSMRNADEMLTDYEKTSEQDITAYDPESDGPTEVLQHTVIDEDGVDGENNEQEVDEDTGRLLSEENIRYLNHTADDARVNDDPMQIADVVTGVEKHQHESEITGTDTHIKSLMSENNSLFDTENIVKGDIDSLYISRDEVEEENDEDISEFDEQDDDGYVDEEHGVVSDEFTVVDEDEPVEDEVQDEDDDREQYDEE